jgi:DNA end-binding protein Ku
MPRNTRDRSKEADLNLPSVPTESAASPALPARPSWSGLLRFSLVTVPVKAYPAVTSTSKPQFNQLHAGCGQRIRHEKRCPNHGPVDAAAIVRGYAYGPDQYVVMQAEELERFRPARDKALVLEQSVPLHDIDPVFFAGRCLYLLPDGPGAHHGYGVLAATLTQAGTAFLGRVVLSGNRQLVLVRARGRLLMLDVLNYPAEVRATSGWEATLRANDGSTEELRLARQLVDAASSPLDWSRFRDTNTEELRALIEAKIANQPPPDATAAAATPDMLPMLEALKQSVAAASSPRMATQAPPARGRRRNSA